MTKVLIIWHGTEDNKVHLYLLPESLVQEYMVCHGKILNDLDCSEEEANSDIGDRIEHLAAMLGEQEHTIKIPTLDEVKELNKRRKSEEVEMYKAEDLEELPIIKAPWSKYLVENVIEIMEPGAIKILYTGWFY